MTWVMVQGLARALAAAVAAVAVEAVADVAEALVMLMPSLLFEGVCSRKALMMRMDLLT